MICCKNVVDVTSFRKKKLYLENFEIVWLICPIYLFYFIVNV